jgi:hypothetical protein
MSQSLLSMLIIVQNEKDLRNFFKGNYVRTIGPVIKMKFYVIGRLSIENNEKMREIL